MPEKGLKYVARTTVGADNTALAMGSGDMEVFATPAMVALMEHAAMYAVAADLPEGSTTVGASMETTHVRPSASGRHRRGGGTRGDGGTQAHLPGSRFRRGGADRRRNPCALYRGPGQIPVEALNPHLSERSPRREGREWRGSYMERTCKR